MIAVILKRVGKSGNSMPMDRAVAARIEALLSCEYFSESLNLIMADMGMKFSKCMHFWLDRRLAALLEFADKCHGLTHANFFGCRNLTDAAVLAVADKCRGLTHANFGGCHNLTDASVLELADKCRGLTHADLVTATS